jgi:ABC-type lipoprotein release transport system permease subunit
LSGKDREILIGEKLSEKLAVDLGDKIVAMSNTPDGEIASEVFRIVGIFRSPSSDFDKTDIFIPLFTAQRMLELGSNVHEFAVIFNDYLQADKIAETIRDDIDSDYEVLSYNDILPLLVLQVDMYKEMVYIINFIIGLSLIFGIVNSMLMSVFERIQEIGVLMSIGMKNIKIIWMILFEAFILGALGTFLGILSGYIVFSLFLADGINLSVFAQSLQSFGVGAIIYPILSLENLVSLLIMIPFITLVGALYPAYKAVKLEPVYAIRYV